MFVLIFWSKLNYSNTGNTWKLINEEKISEVDVLTEETVQAILKSIQKEYKIKGKNLYMGTRIPLTGQMHGGDLAKTMVILGKDVCLKRLAYAKENLI